MQHDQPNPDSAARCTVPVAVAWPIGLDHSITVRPIVPEDAALTRDFFNALSQDSRYNRFFGAGTALSPEWLDRLTRIDFSRDMALIATVTLDGCETEVGVARYARLSDDETAEFALTVADVWQGRGLGPRMMQRLIATARTAGVKRLVGDVLASNTPMLRLLRQLGFRIAIHEESRELRVATLDLDESSRLAA